MRRYDRPSATAVLGAVGSLMLFSFLLIVFAVALYAFFGGTALLIVLGIGAAALLYGFIASR